MSGAGAARREDDGEERNEGRPAERKPENRRRSAPKRGEGSDGSWRPGGGWTSGEAGPGIPAAPVTFRYPERLGPFNLWIDGEVYAEREEALIACRRYAEVLERKRARVGRGAGPRQLADDELVTAAALLLRAFDNLWERIRVQPGIMSLGESRLVRRLVLASTVEWALDIIYQIKGIERVDLDAGEQRWRVTGRGWRGELSWSVEGTSRSFPAGDAKAGELALLEACALAYANCMASLVGDAELAART